MQRERLGPRRPFSKWAPRRVAGRGPRASLPTPAWRRALVCAGAARLRQESQIPCPAPYWGPRIEALGTGNTIHQDLLGTQSLLPGCQKRVRRVLRSWKERLLNTGEPAQGCAEARELAMLGTGHDLAPPDQQRRTNLERVECLRGTDRSQERASLLFLDPLGALESDRSRNLWQRPFLPYASLAQTPGWGLCGEQAGCAVQPRSPTCVILTNQGPKYR